MKDWIKEGKKLSKENDLQAIVLITVSKDGTTGIHTYGENKHKCEVIGRWAQGLWKGAISVSPFRTIFGWGNNGIPQPLTYDETMSLSVNTIRNVETMEGKKNEHYDTSIL